MRQRLLRPVKRAAVALKLMPTTMSGKRWLKRLVYGPEVKMPAELSPEADSYLPPTPVDPNVPDLRHKIIYCTAMKSV